MYQAKWTIIPHETLFVIEGKNVYFNIGKSPISIKFKSGLGQNDGLENVKHEYI